MTIMELEVAVIFLRIEPSSGVPVYRQIMEQIRYQIAAEMLRPGTQLPSARQLAQELAVNGNTILKVYKELGKEHLVRVDRGKGTFVAETSVQLRRSERRGLVGDLLGEAVAKGMQLGLSYAEVRSMLEDEYIARAQGRVGEEEC